MKLNYKGSHDNFLIYGTKQLTHVHIVYSKADGAQVNKDLLS